MCSRTALLLGLLLAAAAWPCSLAGKAGQVRFASPAKGSRGVPLNAEVKLVIDGDRPQSVYTLRDVDAGAAVETRVTTVVDSRTEKGTLFKASYSLVRLRPVTLLVPNHTYVATWRGFEVTRFTTGDTVDRTAPTAPGPISSKFVAEEDTCFGDTRRYDLSFDAATDQETPPEQLIYLAKLEGDRGLRLAVMTPTSLALGQTRDDGNLLLPEPARLEGTVEALDWAGNSGPPRSVHASPGFAGLYGSEVWRMLPEKLQAGLGGACGLFSVLGAVWAALFVRKAWRSSRAKASANSSG